MYFANPFNWMIINFVYLMVCLINIYCRLYKEHIVCDLFNCIVYCIFYLDQSKPLLQLIASLYQSITFIYWSNNLLSSISIKLSFNTFWVGKLNLVIFIFIERYPLAIKILKVTMWHSKVIILLFVRANL